MRFVDLFSGLGGFHVGLRRVGHRCVFACDSDPQLRALYEKNFGLKPAGDIRQVKVADIPSHDILCAGFPCQPFSKAGEQQGLDCPAHGDLIDYVIAILAEHKPRFFILENVANLLRHNGGRTWLKISMQLRHAGYYLAVRRLSPERFGVPQLRDRAFIVGDRSDEFDFDLLQPYESPSTSLRDILDINPSEARKVGVKAVTALEIWQDFLATYPKRAKKPHVPIWSMEFGATYPFETTTPASISSRELARYCGSHGLDLSSVPAKDRLDHVPAYARHGAKQFPGWKQGFIRSNRTLYEDNKNWIDKWLPAVLDFEPSYQKFEWNFRSPKRDIYDNIIQFRGSGIRVKEPTYAPALVAMTTSQTPIVGWEMRYMTVRECARLQDLEDLDHLPAADSRAFAALGNAVNARLVELIGRHLLGSKTVGPKQFRLKLTPAVKARREFHVG